MESGKLDEELARMSDIADYIGPRCLLLCNESFAATNERDGSQIARQVLDALLAEQIKVVFVTHLFDLSHGYHERHLSTMLFLRAQRGREDAHSYRLCEGEPLPTSYGAESYRKVFCKERGRDARRCHRQLTVDAPPVYRQNTHVSRILTNSERATACNSFVLAC